MAYSLIGEVNRLKNIKYDIADTIRDKGVDIPDNAKFNEFNSYIDQIQSGSGGGSDIGLDLSRSIMLYNGDELKYSLYSATGDTYTSLGLDK